ncbi:SCP-like extracellular protein [Phytophthora megakarya]|uniref:SCP-like extracellular protein n=1 Tax=Phytophthora megakarya TaxID=4795 RepID=A0A225X2H4_9STRA|nr:SCP-like extracellular protein [Phytophthora megakarya]
MHLLGLVVALIGFSTSTAVEVNLAAVVNVSIPTPIIGDAIFEDLETPAPIIGQGIFEDLQNATIMPTHRNLQAGFQAELLNAVNRERSANGVAPLCMNSKLQNAAQGHSNDMAAKDYMSHTGSDGSTMSQRVQGAGYDRTAAGENVAAGQTSVEEVMKAWMASTRHRDNILRKKFTMFGCGYAYGDSSTYKHYWTQNFGRSNTEKCS